MGLALVARWIGGHLVVQARLPAVGRELRGPARLRVLRFRAASATGSALLTLFGLAVALGMLVVALGMLAVSAPPGVAQVVPSTTPTVAASGGAGTTSGSLVLAIESPATDQQVHTDRDFLIVGYALDKSATINQGVAGQRHRSGATVHG